MGRRWRESAEWARTHTRWQPGSEQKPYPKSPHRGKRCLGFKGRGPAGRPSRGGWASRSGGDGSAGWARPGTARPAATSPRRPRLTPSIHAARRQIARFRILRYRNNMTDAELTRALERCEIPNDGFPHESHLRVAWTYLRESPSVEDAVDRMASTLRRFAASVGKSEKYSHPTTVFWMYQLAAVRALMPDADCDLALRAYPRLLDKNLILADDAVNATASGSSHPSRHAPDRALPR